MTTIPQSSAEDLEFNVQTGVVEQHDRFWEKVSRGGWENETFRAIDSHTGRNTLAIDCGAWIGPTALYLAHRVGLCLAFEPDPMSFATLAENLALNSEAEWSSRLKIFNEAIHATGAPITIGGKGGDSMTSVLNTTEARNTWTVQTRRLQDVVAEYRGGFSNVFVKIDVEGAEYDIVPSIAEVLADKSISFLISFHHRWKRLAMVEIYDTPQQAAEEFIATLERVVAALPWDRNIRTIDGQILDRQATEQAASAGRSFGSELVID